MALSGDSKVCMSLPRSPDVTPAMRSQSSRLPERSELDPKKPPTLDRTKLRGAHVIHVLPGEVGTCVAPGRSRPYWQDQPYRAMCPWPSTCGCTCCEKAAGWVEHCLLAGVTWPYVICKNMTRACAICLGCPGRKNYDMQINEFRMSLAHCGLIAWF